MADDFAWGRKGGDPSSVERLTRSLAESNVQGLRVTSALRVGSITTSGSVSNHAYGLAIDVVGSIPAMGQYAAFMQSRYGPYLLELIHRGPGYSGGIYHGRAHQYKNSLLSAHENHVHVAATLAGLNANGATPTPVKDDGSWTDKLPDVTAPYDSAKEGVETVKELAANVKKAIAILSEPKSYIAPSIAIAGTILVFTGIVITAKRA